MSRAMELLKHSSWAGFSQEAYGQFVSWVQSILMPQMDVYAYDITKPWVAAGAQNVYGNW